MKVMQSKVPAVTSTFLQIRSGSEFISPAKQRVSGQNAIQTCLAYLMTSECRVA